MAWHGQGNGEGGAPVLVWWGWKQGHLGYTLAWLTGKDGGHLDCCLGVADSDKGCSERQVGADTEEHGVSQAGQQP